MKNALIMVAVMSSASGAYAAEAAHATVSVHYVFSEQSPDYLEGLVTNPLERLLGAVPRVSEIASTTDHRSVNVILKFAGGATEHDLAAVNQAIQEAAIEKAIVVKSRTASLTAQR